MRPWASPRRADERASRRGPSLRSELGVDRPRRVQLERSRVLVAQGAAGEPHQLHARVPSRRAPRAAARSRCAPRARRARPRRRPRPARPRPALVPPSLRACPPRAPSASRSSSRRPAARPPRRRPRASSRRRPGSNSSAPGGLARSPPAPCGSRPPPHRASPWASRSRARPGCGSRPRPARLPIGLLGRVEVAEHSVDLALPVAGLAGRRLVLSVAGSARSPGAPRPAPRTRRPAQLHELGAMHEAAAGEATRSGWRSHQPGEGGGPLLRATDLLGVLAGQDHAAVDDPRRRSATARRAVDRDHRLVEQPQALLDAPESDQDVALLVGREREEVGVAEALGRSPRPRRPWPRRVSRSPLASCSMTTGSSR